MKAENIHMGYFGYKREPISVTTMQCPGVIEAFRILLEQEKPTQVLEIGTAHAGLTLIIRDILDEIGLVETPIHTYDISADGEPLEYDIKKGARIKFSKENLFNHLYDNLLDPLGPNGVVEYIQRPGGSLVLCDGGCKRCEVNILSKFLKIGDVIMAHDYAPDAEYFERHIKGKIWDWHEIQDSDIQEAVDKYHLQPCLQEEFLKVVWVCKKRSS